MYMKCNNIWLASFPISLEFVRFPQEGLDSDILRE